MPRNRKENHLLLLNHSKDKHIDLNAKTDYGHTALMFACYEGHTDVVKLLMDHSVDKHIDLNAKTYGLGTTAFMLACKKGQKDVVELLLDYSKDKNIDLYAKTNYGGTVFNLGRTKAIRQILLDHLGDLVSHLRDGVVSHQGHEFVSYL